MPVSAVQPQLSASSSYVILTSVSETARCTSRLKNARHASSRECFCQTIGCLRIIQLHARSGPRKIDSPVTCLCLGAVSFHKRLQTSRAFSVGVSASMMDTGCFSLSVDMSLFLVTLPCAVSTLHSKPCKCSSWRCDADLRARCILFGEIESIAHEPTVTSVVDRVTIHELLLRHCLSPLIIHRESFLQCACSAESQTRTALTLVLQRCHNLDTALRSIPITWRVQSATFPVEPS